MKMNYQQTLITAFVFVCLMGSSIAQATRWDAGKFQFPYIYIPDMDGFSYCPNYKFSSLDLFFEEQYLNTSLIFFNQRHIARIINKWLEENSFNGVFPKALAQLTGLYVKRNFNVSKSVHLNLSLDEKFIDTIQLTKTIPNELIFPILFSRFIVPWCSNLPNEAVRCSKSVGRETAKKLMSLNPKSLWNNYYSVLLSMPSEYHQGKGSFITEIMRGACGEVSCLATGYINRNLKSCKAYQLQANAFPHYEAELNKNNIFIDHSVTLVVDRRKVSLDSLQAHILLNQFFGKDGFIFVDPWLRIAYPSNDRFARYYLYTTLLIASNLRVNKPIEVNQKNIEKFGNMMVNSGYFSMIDY